jgi:DNA-binding transcriptional LysR family regulator
MTDAQLKALIAVVDQGGFTAAARHLHTTQSAMSHAIAELEQSLRVTLLLRGPQGVRLTEIGERTVEHAREIMGLKAAIEREAEAARKLQSGTLRVGSWGVSASRLLLPPILQAFARSYPAVSVELIEGSDPEIEQWLRDGTVDVGFVTLPNEEFDAVKLAQDEMVAILPEAHPLAAGARVDPARLEGIPFIMCSGGCEALILAAVRGAPLDIRYRIRDVDTMVVMVAQGMGVAVKPAMAIPDPLPPGVVLRPLQPRRERQIGLAVRRRSEMTPACRAFLRVAEAESALARQAAS